MTNAEAEEEERCETERYASLPSDQENDIELYEGALEVIAMLMQKKGISYLRVVTRDSKKKVPE